MCIRDSRSFVLVNRLLLIVNLLLCDRISGESRAVAVQIYLSLAERRLIVRQLALYLCQSRLVRPRVYIQQWIAFVDHLAFTIKDIHDLALHPARNRDGINRRDCPEGLDVDANIALARG